MTTFNISEELRTLRAKYAQILKEKVAYEAEFLTQSAIIGSLREGKDKSTDLLRVALRDAKFQQKRYDELESKLMKVTSTSTTGRSDNFADDAIFKRGEGSLHRTVEDPLKSPEGGDYVSSKDMTMRIHSLEESFKATLSTKDIELSSSVAELNRLKKANGMLIKQCGDLRKSNELLFIEIEGLKENVISSRSMSENCEDLESINERLRKDLQESLRKNFELSNELREYSSTLTSNEELKLSVKLLKDDKRDMEESKRSLSIQLDAATADLKATRGLNETLSSEKEYCNKMIDELKESNSRLSAECRTLQGEFNKANSLLSTMRSENSTLQERLTGAENSVLRLESKSSIDMEVRQLKSQLSEAKRQIIEQNIEKEAEKASSTSVSIIEREEHSRKVYEKVIIDLRTELEKMRRSESVFLEQIEALKMKCAKIDELEMENTLYKETAQKAKEELNSYSASISEAYGHREKSFCDSAHTMNELDRIKIEVDSLRSENKVLNEDLDRERTRVKAYNSDKLRIENESADLKTTNSKLEAVVGELKYQIRVLENDLEKARNTSEDQKTTIVEYSTKMEKLENSQSELREKLQESHNSINVMKFDGHDLSLELKSLQKMREEYRKEIQLSRETISSQRSNIAQKNREIESLRRDIESIKNEKFNFVENSVMLQTGLNESRLQELKKEVNLTVATLRRDEQLNVDTLSTLKTALDHEKDKSAGLSKIVNELEQRMSYCVQELDMYRSLDIYRNSVESQLKGYRDDEDVSANVPTPLSRSPLVRSHMRKSVFSYHTDDREQEHDKLNVGDLSASIRPVDTSFSILNSSQLRKSNDLLNRSTKLPSRRDFEMAKKLLLSSR